MFGLTLIKTAKLATLKDKARDAGIYKQERDEALGKIERMMSGLKQAAAKRVKVG